VFADLEDPRTGNARQHDLLEILLIGLFTVLCGGETYADIAHFGHDNREFLQEFLTLEHGIPSHDTFSRVFRLLDPAPFHVCSLCFMRAFAEGCRGVVALDGKTLRRPFDRACGHSPLHLVSSWAVEQRLVLGQIAVDAKSNEITAVPQRLRMLSLDGVVVTADTMACQREIARLVIDQGGAYVLAPKANQGTPFEDVKLFLDDPAVGLATATTTDGAHGRIEVRAAALSPKIPWLQEHHALPGLQAIGKVTATRVAHGHTSQQTRYFLMSQAFSPRALSLNRAGALRHRERAAWGLGRDHERGRAAHPQGSGPREPCSAAPARPQSRETRARHGLHEGQAQARRVGHAYLATLLAQAAQIQMRSPCLIGLAP
jgi:hypothetical protein